MLSPSTKAPAHARRDVPRHVRWARRLAPCLAAPLATLAVLLAAMALTGVYPFGDVPFVARDGVLQYVGFHGWFHQVLTGEDSLVYSFSKGLGGGTFALYAYYLSSPLALMAAFVRPEHMAQALTLIMVAKICLASLTCAVYLTSRAVSALDELGAHTLDATFSAGGTITGTATVGEGQKLLITVPLEAGWTATVDGREVELEDVDGLIAVPMEAGTHEVALEYHTPGLIPGAIISAAGCALAGAWAAVAARRRGA